MLMKKPRPVPAGVFYAAKTTDNRNYLNIPIPLTGNEVRLSSGFLFYKYDGFPSQHYTGISIV